MWCSCAHGVPVRGLSLGVKYSIMWGQKLDRSFQPNSNRQHAINSTASWSIRAKTTRIENSKRHGAKVVLESFAVRSGSELLYCVLAHTTKTYMGAQKTTCHCIASKLAKMTSKELLVGLKVSGPSCDFPSYAPTRSICDPCHFRS
jgi:hypothetical protein